jgi:hypothetical protein
VGIQPHSFRNCPLDVWRFSQTRQHRICHRSGRLGDRVGCTLDCKLYHYRLLIDKHERLGWLRRQLIPPATHRALEQAVTGR